MRASLPANCAWIRSLMISSAAMGASSARPTTAHVGLDLSDRPYLMKARETQLRFQRLSACPAAQHTDRDGGLSGIRHQSRCDLVVLAGVNLDWMSKIMDNLEARYFGRADRQHGNRWCVGSGQHDRPYRAAVVGHCRKGHRLGQGGKERSPRNGLRRRATFARIAGTQLRLIVSIDEARVSAAINREIFAPPTLGFVCRSCCSRRPGRCREADHPADRDDGGDGYAVRPGRMVGARRARPPACGVRAAGPSLQTRWRRSSASASASWSPPTG